SSCNGARSRNRVFQQTASLATASRMKEHIPGYWDAGTDEFYTTRTEVATQLSTAGNDQPFA
ncbi:MAG: hypothetical protein AAB433_01595, partial [Nitrospirota bacterium]